jgi:hypothetical protein
VGNFLIGKQKVFLFPTYRENDWEGKGSCEECLKAPPGSLSFFYFFRWPFIFFYASHPTCIIIYIFLYFSFLLTFWLFFYFTCLLVLTFHFYMILLPFSFSGRQPSFALGLFNSIFLFSFLLHLMLPFFFIYFLISFIFFFFFFDLKNSPSFLLFATIFKFIG